MKTFKNLINHIAPVLLTLALLFLYSFLLRSKYNADGVLFFVYIILAAIVSGTLCISFHEFGHLIMGKKNNFIFVSTVMLFLKFKKVGKKTKFSLTFPLEEAGYTEMIPKNSDNLYKRFYKYTLGGPVFSFILLILSIPAFLINMPAYVYIFYGMIAPISCYNFFGNILPISSYGIGNDGFVLKSLRVKDDNSKNILSVLSIQAELYNGKTPSQIEKEYYFNCPQLQEDNLNFITLLYYRYLYFLDCNDTENLSDTVERIATLMEYMPKNFQNICKTEFVYYYSIVKKDLDKADEYVYDIEKYLNKNNTPEVLRAKIAYLTACGEDKSKIDKFYKKVKKELKKQNLKGIVLFEEKLLDRVKRMSL